MDAEIWWAFTKLRLVAVIVELTRIWLFILISLWGAAGWFLLWRKVREGREAALEQMGNTIMATIHRTVVQIVELTVVPYINEAKAHGAFCQDWHCIYREWRDSCFGLEDCAGPHYCTVCSFDDEETTHDGICD